MPFLISWSVISIYCQSFTTSVKVPSEGPKKCLGWTTNFDDRFKTRARKCANLNFIGFKMTLSLKKIFWKISLFCHSVNVSWVHCCFGPHWLVVGSKNISFVFNSALHSVFFFFSFSLSRRRPFQWFLVILFAHFNTCTNFSLKSTQLWRPSHSYLETGKTDSLLWSTVSALGMHADPGPVSKSCGEQQTHSIALIASQMAVIHLLLGLLCWSEFEWQMKAPSVSWSFHQ